MSFVTLSHTKLLLQVCSCSFSPYQHTYLYTYFNIILNHLRFKPFPVAFCLLMMLSMWLIVCQRSHSAHKDAKSLSVQSPCLFFVPLERHLLPGSLFSVSIHVRVYIPHVCTYVLLPTVIKSCIVGVGAFVCVYVYILPKPLFKS